MTAGFAAVNLKMQVTKGSLASLHKSAETLGKDAI